MQIDREKLLDWVKQEEKFLTTHSEFDKGCAFQLKNLIKEIESGTFDIKEDTDHADRG